LIDWSLITGGGTGKYFPSKWIPPLLKPKSKAEPLGIRFMIVKDSSEEDEWKFLRKLLNGPCQVNLNDP
jgi:hypothetical protein